MGRWAESGITDGDVGRRVFAIDIEFFVSTRDGDRDVMELDLIFSYLQNKFKYGKLLVKKLVAERYRSGLQNRHSGIII